MRPRIPAECLQWTEMICWLLWHRLCCYSLLSRIVCMIVTVMMMMMFLVKSERNRIRLCFVYESPN